MSRKILVLPGDGIGPEITAEAVKVLKACQAAGLDVDIEEGLVGGAGYDAHGEPLPGDPRAGAGRRRHPAWRRGRA